MLECSCLLLLVNVINPSVTIVFLPFLAGVASGATRAALTQHFALQNNAADISAKVLSFIWTRNAQIQVLVRRILVVFSLYDRKAAKRQLQQ